MDRERYKFEEGDKVYVLFGYNEIKECEVIRYHKGLKMYEVSYKYYDRESGFFRPTKRYVREEDISLFYNKKPPLPQQNQMKLIKLKDQMPDKNTDGEKVLIYRKLNESQKEQCFSIHPVDMLKHCDSENTWWMALPKPPDEL